MFCFACLKDKQSRLPLDQPDRRASNFLEIIHSFWSDGTLGRARYFPKGIDHFSRKTFVYYLECKNEVKNIFKIFKKMVFNQKGVRMKNLRTDNSSEYCNIAFETILCKFGIQHQTTIPYNSEQHGLAERTNRTIIEKARCML